MHKNMSHPLRCCATKEKTCRHKFRGLLRARATIIFLVQWRPPRKKHSGTGSVISYVPARPSFFEVQGRVTQKLRGDFCSPTQQMPLGSVPQIQHFLFLGGVLKMNTLCNNFGSSFSLWFRWRLSHEDVFETAAGRQST